MLGNRLSFLSALNRYYFTWDECQETKEPWVVLLMRLEECAFFDFYFKKMEFVKSYKIALWRPLNKMKSIYIIYKFWSLLDFSTFRKSLAVRNIECIRMKTTADVKIPKFTYKWISGFELSLWKRKNIAQNCAMFCFISNDLGFGLLRWVLL